MQLFLTRRRWQVKFCSSCQKRATSGVTRPKFFGGLMMFDFRRASVFLIGTPLLTAQND